MANVIELGLDNVKTKDLPHIKYWMPEVIVFDNEDVNETMFVITLEKNMHSLKFKTALKNNGEINVFGSLDDHPCFWLNVDDYTLIVEVDLPVEIQKTLKDRRINFYFYEIDNTCIGCVSYGH